MKTLTKIEGILLKLARYWNIDSNDIIIIEEKPLTLVIGARLVLVVWE